LRRYIVHDFVRRKFFSNICNNAPLASELGVNLTLQGTDLDGLMRAANRGDARAYRDLLHFLAPIVRGFARKAFARYGRPTQDVEDVVQDALLALHLKRHTWVEQRPLLPWVHAITRNKLLDHLRRTRRGRHVPIDDFNDLLIDENTPSAADGLDIDVAIGRLDGRQRHVVLAISLEGRSAREVGVQLGITESAVRVTLHRALRSLARSMRDEQK
jgi:RNA polymerase sigma-70 factor (ECF subfamily)